MDRARSFCCHRCCLMSVSPHLATIMLLCMDMMSLACNMSKDGLEGAILGMWHWRVCGDTPESFSHFHHGKATEEGENSAFRHGALLGQLHFGHSSTKMGSNQEAYDAASCQALSGSPTPGEDPVSKAGVTARGAHFTPTFFYGKHCFKVISDSEEEDNGNNEEYEFSRSDRNRSKGEYECS